MPSPGRILHLRTPSGPGVRDDGGYDALDEVPIFYDSLVSKLIAWGETRDAAIARLRRAIARVRDRRHPDDAAVLPLAAGRAGLSRGARGHDVPRSRARRPQRHAVRRGHCRVGRRRGDCRRAPHAGLRPRGPSADPGVHVCLDAKRQARSAAVAACAWSWKSRAAADRSRSSAATIASRCGWTGSRSASKRRRSPAADGRCDCPVRAASTRSSSSRGLTRRGLEALVDGLSVPVRVSSGTAVAKKAGGAR